MQIKILLLISFILYLVLKLKANKRFAWYDLMICAAIIASFTIIRTGRLDEPAAYLIPFDVFVQIWNRGWPGESKYIAIGVLGNIAMFIPLGLIMSQKDRKWYWMLIPFAVSLCIESAQYYTCLGTFEVDDIISNVIGALIGYQIGISLNGAHQRCCVVSGSYLGVLLFVCLKSMLFS